MDTPPQKSFKLLLIGESCVDEYFLGTVDRISPEAPVPILKVCETTRKEGMGGNVLSNFLSLGNDVTFLSNDGGIKKTRVIDNRHNQQLVRIDWEEHIEPFDISSLPDISKYAAVVISDYNKGFLPISVLIDITNRAHVAGRPVFIDTKKQDIEGIENCFLKLNELEYNSLHPLPSTRNEYIITLGGRGTMWNGQVFPAQEATLFDQTGAGDTFLAAFVNSYLIYQDIEMAIGWANICASISVTKLGCYAVTKEDINDHSSKTS